MNRVDILELAVTSSRISHISLATPLPAQSTEFGASGLPGASASRANRSGPGEFLIAFTYQGHTNFAMHLYHGNYVHHRHDHHNAQLMVAFYFFIDSSRPVVASDLSSVVRIAKETARRSKIVKLPRLHIEISKPALSIRI